MANNPFDRTIINPREKPLSSDIDQAQSQLDYALRFMAEAAFAHRSSDASEARVSSTGFFGNDFRITPQASPNMTVIVKAGLGFFYVPTDVPSAVGGVVGVDDLSPYKPMALMADVQLAVPAAPGSNSRIDIIEVRPNRLSGNPNTRLILDPVTGAFNPNTVNKTLAFSLDGSVGSVNDPALSTAAIGYKTGISGVTPVAPTVTPGYVKIGEVRLTAGEVVVSGSNIGDFRPLLGHGGVISATGRFRLLWNAGSPTINFFTNVVTPPGVRMSAAPLVANGRSACRIFVTGGNFQRASWQITVESGPQVLGGLGPPCLKLLSAGFFVGALDTSNVSILNGAVPPQLTAIGPQSARADIISLIRDASGLDTPTSVALEDIVYVITAHLSY